MTEIGIQFYHYTRYNPLDFCNAPGPVPDAGSLERLKPIYDIRDRNRLYVHIFCVAKLPSSLSLTGNVQIAGKQGKTCWHNGTIIIDGEGTYHSEDSRPGNRNSDMVPILVSLQNDTVPVDNYFCVSRIPFSLERITYLVNKLAENRPCRRLEKINPSVIGNKVQVINKKRCVILTDYMRIAQSLNDLYSRELDTYVSWATNKARACVRTLHGMITGLIKQFPEYTKCLADKEDQLTPLDFDNTPMKPHGEWMKKYESREKDLINAYEVYSRALTAWMDKPEYREMLSDYSGTDANIELGEQELAFCLKGINNSKYGIDYVNKVAGDENHWIMINVIETSRKAIDATWEILLVFTTLRVSEKGPDYLVPKLIQAIITRQYKGSKNTAWNIVYSNLIYKQRLDGVKEYITIPNVVSNKVNFLDVLRDKNTADIIKNNLIGIIIAYYTLDIIRNHNIPTFEKVIDLIISAASLLNETFGTIMGTAAAKAAAKTIGLRIIAVASLISYLQSSYKMTSAIQLNDNDAAVFHGISALGSVITGITAVCYSGAVVAGGSVIGAPVAFGLFALGAVLGFGGEILAGAKTDTDLEAWLKHCYWGKYSNNDYSYWSTWDYLYHPGTTSFERLNREMLVLQQILFSAFLERNARKANGSDNFFIVTLKPSLITVYSKLKLCVWKVVDGEESVLYNHELSSDELLVRKDPNGQITGIDLYLFYTKKLKDDAVFRNIVSVPRLENACKQAAHIGAKTTVYCGIEIDVFGDGKVFVPADREKQEINKVVLRG